MRLSHLPAALVAGALLTGIVSCATTIDGTGTVASDVVAGGPTATGTGSTPEPTTAPTSASPTPEPTTPSPTTDPLQVKRRLLCVLERAAITTVNSQFNKSKDRSAQLKVLRTGSTTIQGHITRSGLPPKDTVRRMGQGVLNELNRLVTGATQGNSPSTKPYNTATQTFQTACSGLS